ncbi:GtrA family protein [Roseobacter sinensis]|uniref:GtrA family protein n=1 Tax=Roseobacter sinensis TaxID=2931391 RepID=A0ABT3BD86_9RHOB|nr:GtrA family protein [Roseobacter sp. WL0113]MCV3271541.1 GtrA family protein [Roseobacter sp. WL0113]
MQMLRFALIGGLVALSYLLLYLGFLALDLSRGWANTLAFGLAICLQYAGQAGFTFRKRLLDNVQMARFGAMVGLGFVTSALITGWLAPSLALPDWAAALMVTVVLPVQNYIVMSAWVFAGHKVGGTPL